MDMELQVNKSELVSKPIFETVEFSKVRDKYKELFYQLTEVTQTI